MFSVFFSRSPDPMWLLDPVSTRVEDCNPAAVRLLRAEQSGDLIQRSLGELSPGYQPDGRDSARTLRDWLASPQRAAGTRLEWTF